VAGNFAAPADRGVLLNLDERANLGFIADFAAIQIDEFGKLDRMA
jgi:hypothetical protein